MSNINQYKSQKTKEIEKTISTNFLLRGYEELLRVIGLGSNKNSGDKSQITVSLDKYENKLIKRRGKDKYL